MSLRLRSVLMSACVIGQLFLVSAAPAQDRASDEELPPFRMVRSLQAMQDAATAGDVAAGEMQAFLLKAIDKRLRAVDRTAFDDSRNVDAAMIYAMSGGNPATLAYLVSRDIDGNFDNRLTDALGHYLTGKAALISENLAKTVEEYRAQRIAPYLYLVLANSVSQYDPGGAVLFYDQARLLAPGTNIEEAALRRAFVLSVRGKVVTGATGKVKGTSDARDKDRAFRYALTFMRRFPHSPYASQVADVFVELVVEHDSEAARAAASEALGFLDAPRRREVYLRIARAAAIAGRQALTRYATETAQGLSAPGGKAEEALPSLYSGLVNVPSGDILEAMKQIESVPEVELSESDRALRDAARQVAEDILREPQPSAPPPATPTPPVADAAPPGAPPASSTAGTGSGGSPFAATPPAQAEAAPPAVAQQEAAAAAEVDPEVSTFVKNGQSKLGEIDALLEGTK